MDFKIDKKNITFKIKRNKFIKLLQYEHYLSTKLKGRDKAAFRALSALFTCVDSEIEDKLYEISEPMAEKVISYFGTNPRHKADKHRGRIEHAIQNYILIYNTGKYLKKECIKSCYQFLRIKTSLSHYRSTAIATAIAFEFNLMDKGEKKKLSIGANYNNADELFELGKSITNPYKNKSADKSALFEL